MSKNNITLIYILIIMIGVAVQYRYILWIVFLTSYVNRRTEFYFLYLEHFYYFLLLTFQLKNVVV